MVLIDRIVVNQPVYNLFNRYIEESVVPTCLDNGIGLIVFFRWLRGC